MNLKVSKCKNFSGVIEVPGDKSISHRAVIISSLAQGESRIKNFLNAGDCISTLNCLEEIGIKIERLEETEIVVRGVGFYGFQKPAKTLDVGNSGTTIRMLPAILAAQNFTSVITGDESIKRRPMDRIIEPLKLMGADIQGTGKENLAPLTIKGEKLKGINYTTPVPSAQVKSAILLAGLLAEGQTTVNEQYLSRDHTEKMLVSIGAEIKIDKTSTMVIGKSPFNGQEILVPGDISSAAFFIVAGLIIPDSEITIKNVGINPTRIGFLEVLKQMGAQIKQENWQLKNGEPRADLIIKSSRLNGITIEGEIIPRLIDEIPILAVAAALANGTTIIKDAKELRVKETDRIKAIYNELKKMGAEIEEKEDGFIVEGPAKLKGAVCESYNDHRIAMAMSIAGLAAEGETIINNTVCINISFPNFEEILNLCIRD
ncbi:MAG: 3-phosphoshikimate 1-carboxyvinyltransferase [Actinobacteria bacterium]|nr:3-phosphoshikimate 1-carboxyvinyltransferase [Actinomycetota bacterium]